LRWTISNPGCPPSNDNMLIQVYALPSTASAGLSQSVCVSTSSAALSANVPTLGVGTDAYKRCSLEQRRARDRPSPARRH
jgi:hypothetical protein